MNHHYKTGPLAVVHFTPLTTWITTVNLFDFDRVKATCFTTPVQVRTFILMYTVSGTLINKITNSILDQSNLNAGTSDHGIVYIPSEAITKVTELSTWLRTSMRQVFKIDKKYSSQTGGKITEKANANGNALDIGSFQTFIKKTKNEQNSVLLISTHKRPSIPTGLFYPRERYAHISVKSISTLTWNQDWNKVEDNVRKKQMDLVKLAEIFSGAKVLKLQKHLATNLYFRLLAVKLVTTNKGAKTPGIDNQLLLSDSDKLDMVELLKNIIINPSTYTAKPVKRVFIPKTAGKLRPLGIPTIQDRCVQALINLILEPLVEMTSDRHSYGFRKFRSAKMALGALRVNLRSNPQLYNKYVLDADIKGFFDNISHPWLISNIPLEITLKPILISWLKAGSIHLTKFSESPSGTPQGGIISPTLANFTLNGLEDAITKAVAKDYPVTYYGRIYLGQILGKDGKKRGKLISSQLLCVRYADDFIVTGRSSRMITSTIKPCVEEFLRVRGLSLSPEKTKVLSVRNSDKINFLGYTFQYQQRFSNKYNLFHDNIGQEGIACYPQKGKVQELLSKLKQIFKSSNNLTAYTLISKLNPIIRGWAGYFNLSQSYASRNRINYALYRYAWLWAIKKHPKWGKKAIALRYFLKSPKELHESTDYLNYIGSSPKKWIFRGKTLFNSIYNNFKGGKTIELVDPTIIVSTISAREYRIPKALELIHAYHPEYYKLIETNLKTNFLAIKATKTLKAKLFIKQKGMCSICNNTLLDAELLYDGSTNIHHIKRRADGGTNKINNLTLVHTSCHMELHLKH